MVMSSIQLSTAPCLQSNLNAAAFRYRPAGIWNTSLGEDIPEGCAHDEILDRAI